MPARKRRTSNVLTGKTASVSISRNGLGIEVADVPAVDAALVAKCLLDAVHGGVIEMPDEIDGDDFVLPPEAKRRIGFTI